MLSKQQSMSYISYHSSPFPGGKPANSFFVHISTKCILYIVAAEIPAYLRQHPQHLKVEIKVESNVFVKCSQMALLAAIYLPGQTHCILVFRRNVASYISSRRVEYLSASLPSRHDANYIVSFF